MAETPQNWLSKATEAIRRLADQPWTLFLVLLAVNALGRPCSPTAHDARLYSLQALNQAEHGAYDEDVFLAFGSQDQFSLFSRIVGPLVATLGLRITFFFLYLLFNTLFILALFHLVRALIDDAVVSTLALLFLVTAPLSYGGQGIFMVHEQFFTPRIVGTALTLFALERMVRQHFLAAGLLLVVAGFVHPLMAFGGMMIWANYAACSWLPRRVFAGLLMAALIGAVAILSVPRMATRLFGSMDDDWHQMIRIAVGYNYPDTWSYIDLLNLAVSFALPIVACVSLYRDDPRRQRFFFAATLAGAVGFLTTVAASMLPYALLFQGQPYRVLWILKVLQVPLGFLLIARWSQSMALYARLAALGLVAFFCVSHYSSQELGIYALTIAGSFCFSWANAETYDPSALPSWSWLAVARGLVLGALGWTVYRWLFFFQQRAVIAEHFDLNEWILVGIVSPVVLIGAACVASIWLGQSRGGQVALRWAAVTVALLTPVALFAAEVSPAFQVNHTRLGRDIAFVREFVKDQPLAKTRVPAIYSALARPDLVWIDVKATNYFDVLQTAGVMFNRRTADELQRRIALVNKFEMHHYRQELIFLDDEKQVGFENLYRMSFDGPDPTVDDLVKLCHEPGLDFVVVPHEFSGLYSASNGRIFVYDGQKVRDFNDLSVRARTALSER